MPQLSAVKIKKLNIPNNPMEENSWNAKEARFFKM
jgi:hypothetical protein